jgi:topoisomerase-4 subunit A
MRFPTDSLKLIAQFDPEKVVTAIYFDEKNGAYYAKRFYIETQTLNNRFAFIREGKHSFLDFVTLHQEPVVQLDYGKKKEPEEVDLADAVDIAGWKAVGTRIATSDLKNVVLLNEETDTAEAEDEEKQGALF